jgi:DNA-binding transcriptional LysR family regulator
MFGVPAKYDPLFKIRYRHARGSFFNLLHSSLTRRLCAHACKRLHYYTQSSLKNAIDNGIVSI